MAKQSETEMVLMKAKTNLQFYKRPGEDECKTIFGNFWYQNEDKSGYANIAMEGEIFEAPQSRVNELIESGYAEIAK